MKTVISDIRMPGMNGYEFVKEVKKINPKVNVLLMTAFEIEDNEFHNILPSIASHVAVVDEAIKFVSDKHISILRSHNS